MAPGVAAAVRCFFSLFTVFVSSHKYFLLINDNIKGLGTPLLDSYKTIIDKVTGVSPSYKPEEIRKTVTKILEELGDVSETVSSAIKDGKVTESEKKSISKEIKELEVQISTIKKQVGLGEKHDYKHPSGEKIKNRDEDGLKSE